MVQEGLFAPFENKTDSDGPPSWNYGLVQELLRQKRGYELQNWSIPKVKYETIFA